MNVCVKLNLIKNCDLLKNETAFWDSSKCLHASAADCNTVTSL